MNYIILLFFTYIIIKKNGQLSKKNLIVFLAFLFLLIGLMYNFFMSSTILWTGIESGLSRITTGQMSGLYHYLEIFPQEVNYLMGLSFPNPGGFLPWKPYRLTVEVMNLVHPELEPQGITGSMPTFFWGEMYANFGYLGVIIPPFFIGFFVCALNILFFRLPMTPLRLALFLWAAKHFSDLSGSGLSTFIIDTELLIMGALLFISLKISGRSCIPSRRTQYKNAYILSS